MKKSLCFALLFAAAVLSKNPLRAEPPASATAVKPVNVAPVPFKIVSGTVSVRLNGAPVSPSEVTYVFAPVFDNNRGYLQKINEGSFFMRTHEVPSDQSLTLKISSVYNDSVRGRDGFIERKGRTYTGVVTIQVPYGEDAYDFGVRFLDLR